MARTIRKKKPSAGKARRDDAVAAEVPALLEPYQPKSVLERWAPGLVICLVTVAAYFPSFNNEFVSWDDDHYLYKNQQLIFPDGIRSALFDVFEYRDRKHRGTRPKEDGNRVSHQYYPLVFGVYWLEFRLYERLFDEPTIPNPTPAWDKEEFAMMNPRVAAGFHVTSVLFHCVNIFLLIHLLRGLGLNTWVAAATTALFALTPINVASVAWAAERKNIFSLMFYMLAMMSYLRFRRRGGWIGYVGCLVLYQCALFSKTVSVTFPIMIILTDRLIDRRWTVMSFVRAVPLFAQSAVAAGITVHVESRSRSIPIGHDYQRPLIASAAIWFYALKAAVPVNLLPVYRLWDLPEFRGESAVRDLRWLVPWVAACGAVLVLWIRRRRIPDIAFWALALFVVTQAPMLGFKNINYFQFAFVADHYFYNGGIGVFLLLALIVDWVRRRGAAQPAKHAFTGLVCVVAVLFGMITFDRCQDWKDSESFWYTTITGDRNYRYDDWDDLESIQQSTTGNPICYPSYYNLGNHAWRMARPALRAKDQETFEKYAAKAADLFRMAAWAYRETSIKSQDLWQAQRMVMLIERARGRTQEVADAGRLYLSYTPRHGTANYMVGDALYSLEQYEEAEEYLVAAVGPQSRATLTGRTKCWLMLGNIYLMRGDLDRADACADQALALSPNDNRARKLKEVIASQR